MDNNLYKDIQCRTNGEIYIGVVGPVRTGKSTFIKRFMELFVLPYMVDENVKARTIDELPQSAQGKTIMTTEPKFIPQEAAEINMEDAGKIRVRLIDCVGFMVEGAAGHMEEEENRMVKTPWYSEEIPFVDAAKIGTEKVIKDHATIGVVLTCDGSIGEIPRENYIEAERTTIEQLNKIGKPFVIVLNCIKPYSEEVLALKEELENQYHASVVPMNCKQMKKEDANHVLERVLYEFPVTRMNFFIPKWTEMLSIEHPVKKSLIAYAKYILSNVNKMKDISSEIWKLPDNSMSDAKNPMKSVVMTSMNPSDGSVSFSISVKENYYFEYISEMTGVNIDGEYQLIAMMKELAQKRNEYEKVQDALTSVTQKGYGVVLPNLSEITMDDPVLISHGSKYGVKMKAISPSIHMIKANIETEIAPIVGSKEQAEDLIAYIKEGEENSEGVWTTNIFGKSVGELMESGIKNKIAQMDDECQIKLQDTMQKIVNDSNGGMICIII